MQVIDAPLVALLNNDTEVQLGWLDHLSADPTARGGREQAPAVAVI